MKKLPIKVSIKEQTTTGGAVLGAGAHVDLAQGMFDRPGPKSQEQEEGDFEPELTQIPIVPSEMVATQLATNRPPVDDDDYIPTSGKELGYAVAELAKTVPSEQIKQFYSRVKELAQGSIDTESTDELDAQGEEEMLESKKREQVKRYVNKVLNKMISEGADEPYGSNLPNEYMGVHPTSTLMDIERSGALGKPRSSEAGVRQAMIPMIEKWKVLTRDVDEDTMDDLLAVVRRDIPVFKDMILKKYEKSKSKEYRSYMDFLESFGSTQEGIDALGKAFIGHRFIDPEIENLFAERNRQANKWITAKLPYVTNLEVGFGATLRKLLTGETDFNAKTAPSRVFDGLMELNLSDKDLKDAYQKVLGISIMQLGVGNLRNKDAILSKIGRLSVTPLTRQHNVLEELSAELEENLRDDIEYYEEQQTIDEKAEDFDTFIKQFARFEIKHGPVVK